MIDLRTQEAMDRVKSDTWTGVSCFSFLLFMFCSEDGLNPEKQLRPGVGALQPAGQILPATCFVREVLLEQRCYHRLE